MNEFQYPSGATLLEPEEIEDLKIGHITTREELNRFEQDNINPSGNSPPLLKAGMRASS